MKRDQALATAQEDQHLTADEARASSGAIDTFVKVLGGRDALLDALAVGSDAPEVDRVVSLLLDPRYDALPLRKLCAMANLTIVDLFAAYKSAMISRAHLRAYHEIADKLVPVVKDVMERAAPYTIPCAECQGRGTVTDEKTPDAPPTPCAPCNGQGKLLVHPDLDRQKLALEIAQLITKSAGIVLNQQTNTLIAAGKGDAVGGGSLLDVQAAVRSVLRGPRTPLAPPPVIDAEIVPGTGA